MQKFLIDDHSKFVDNYPELKAVLADFVQAVLIHKPEDIFKFADDFFTPYSPTTAQKPSHMSHTFQH